MQIFPYQSTPFRHGPYVVQLLQESNNSPFRAAIKHVETGEEREFGDLVSLLQFLQAQTKRGLLKMG